VLAFAAGLRGAWDWLALIYFVCCGVSRLARYNVTAETLSAGGDKVAYFEGTPIPTTFLLTAMLAMAASVAGRRQPDLQMPDTRQSH
jgi:CDP-diacylglycerol--serine O-phosphatidyltransferase